MGKNDNGRPADRSKKGILTDGNKETRRLRPRQESLDGIMESQMSCAEEMNWSATGR